MLFFMLIGHANNCIDQSHIFTIRQIRWRLQLTQVPRSLDLALFVSTMTMTMTEPITLSLACACGVNKEGCRQERESTNDNVVALWLTGVVYHASQLKVKGIWWPCIIFAEWMTYNNLQRNIRLLARMKHYYAKPSARCTSFSSKAEVMQLAVLCMLCMQML